MSVLPRDPLLTTLRAIIWFFIGTLCLAAFGLVIAAPAVLFFQGEIAAELLADGVTAPPMFIAALIGVLLAMAALVIMGIYFFWNLLAITDTVRDRDPFIAENATRLTRMGWLTVAIYVGGLFVTIPGAWIASIAADAGEDVTFNAGLDGTGLVMILVLFVLARVFRMGAAMREDLEGTV